MNYYCMLHGIVSEDSEGDCSVCGKMMYPVPTCTQCGRPVADLLAGDTLCISCIRLEQIKINASLPKKLTRSARIVKYFRNLPRTIWREIITRDINLSQK